MSPHLSNKGNTFVLHSFPGSSVVQNPTANARVDPWVGKTPLEKEMATHSSVLAWEIPWTREPDGLQSMESQRVGHNLVTIQQYLLYRAIVRIEKINGKKDNKGESHEFVVVISRSRHLNSLCPFLYL